MVQSSHVMRIMVIQSDLLDAVPEIWTFKVNLLSPDYFRFTLTRIICPFPKEHLESGLGLCELVSVSARGVYGGHNVDCLQYWSGLAFDVEQLQANISSPPVIHPQKKCSKWAVV